MAVSHFLPERGPSKAFGFAGRRDARKQCEKCPEGRFERSGLCGEEVMRMGDGRWTKVLRFVVCFILTLLVMIYITPKAC